MSAAYKHPRKRRLGFTLIEALASVVLLATGVTAVMSALGSMARSEGRAQESERMQRLAIDKYDELVSTGQATTAQSGDFKDRSDDRYTWSLDVQPSGITNVNSITLSVSPSQGSAKQTVSGLVFVRPVTAGATN